MISQQILKNEYTLTKHIFSGITNKKYHENKQKELTSMIINRQSDKMKIIAIMFPIDKDLSIIESFIIRIGGSITFKISFDLLLKLTTLTKSDTHYIINIPNGLIFKNDSEFLIYELEYYEIDFELLLNNKDYNICFQVITEHKKYLIKKYEITKEIKDISLTIKNDDKYIEIFNIEYIPKNISITNDYEIVNFKDTKLIKVDMSSASIGIFIKTDIMDKVSIHVNEQLLLERDKKNIEKIEKDLYWISFEPSKKWNDSVSNIYVKTCDKFRWNDIIVSFNNNKSGTIYLMNCYKLIYFRGFASRQPIFG